MQRTLPPYLFASLFSFSLSLSLPAYKGGHWVLFLSSTGRDQRPHEGSPWPVEGWGEMPSSCFPDFFFVSKSLLYLSVRMQSKQQNSVIIATAAVTKVRTMLHPVSPDRPTFSENSAPERPPHKGAMWQSPRHTLDCILHCIPRNAGRSHHGEAC